METMTTDTYSPSPAWNDAARASEQAELEKAHPPTTYDDKITIKLAPEDYIAKIGELSAARGELVTLEAAKKAAATAFKNQAALVEQLVSVLCKGEEERVVEVRETFLWDTGTVEVRRTDNGALVSERAISAEDRQLSLIHPANGERVSAETGEYVDEDSTPGLFDEDGEDAS